MTKRFYRGCDHRAPVYVLGHAFGWQLLTVEAHVEDALNEYDERFGTRVDFEADAAALADYGGATLADQVESAMMAGDLRVNSGGTTVWVDHYEWLREFATVREARAFIHKH